MPPIFIYPSTILRIFLCTRRASHPLTPKTVSVVQAKVIPPQSCRHFRGCGNASDKQTISPTHAHSLSERTTSPVFGVSPSPLPCLGCFFLYNGSRKEQYFLCSFQIYLKGVVPMNSFHSHLCYRNGYIRIAFRVYDVDRYDCGVVYQPPQVKRKRNNRLLSN